MNILDGGCHRDDDDVRVSESKSKSKSKSACKLFNGCRMHVSIVCEICR